MYTCFPQTRWNRYNTMYKNSVYWKLEYFIEIAAVFCRDKQNTFRGRRYSYTELIPAISHIHISFT
ncbi:MAG: hypothetical protein ACPKQO_07205 [Nitrososphaeraceae archaeon]